MKSPRHSLKASGTRQSSSSIHYDLLKYVLGVRATSWLQAHVVQTERTALMQSGQGAAQTEQAASTPYGQGPAAPKLVPDSPSKQVVTRQRQLMGALPTSPGRFTDGAVPFRKLEEGSPFRRAASLVRATNEVRCGRSNVRASSADANKMSSIASRDQWIETRACETHSHGRKWAVAMGRDM